MIYLCGTTNRLPTKVLVALKKHNQVIRAFYFCGHHAWFFHKNYSSKVNK